ncbi:hypothetical protein SYNTR_1044 [Candidatus Syntrophocurvum alkaliphilum]|uniref:Uncharacterized protein n=1 Tax=Candidatus Syntrophocurvum alkaliphilum TaxID=2293317 RepID=A0A6I6DES7_9FIRM|nr:hypothetical protein [Candidatus Syntrophocurvum alkaliphilum]QGT99637.1 hypothetical protein SYNTR_1044 [Candidatus Syntrophocurvum alkaliphilum]
MTNTNGLDMFISISVQFSEFSSIKYEADNNIIKLELALEGVLEEEGKQEFITNINKCLDCLHKLRNSNPQISKLTFEDLPGITLISFYRDAETLTEEELHLFTTMLKESFNSLIIREEENMLSLEYYKKEIKKSLLKKINKTNTPSNNFFAYREEGRVFVFNK